MDYIRSFRVSFLKCLLFAIFWGSVSLGVNANVSFDPSPLTKVSTIIQDNFTLNWTLHRFGDFMDKRTYEFSSPVFSYNSSSGESKWMMTVRHTTESGYVFSSLQNMSDDERVYSVKYQFEILADAGDTYKAYKSGWHEVVFGRYDKHESALDAFSIYLRTRDSGGKLLLSCNIDLLVYEQLQV